MSAGNKWWDRLAAILGASMLSMSVPVAAWGSTGTGERVVEAAARRPRGGANLVCCLVVIVVVLLLVLWLVRRRRGRPR